MLRLLFILILITGYTKSQAFNFDFKHQVYQLKNLSEKEFFAQFSYTDYIRQYGIDKIALLETHRTYLDEMNKNGDEFIIQLFENYMDSVLLDFQNIDSIKQQLLYAEIATHSENYLADSIYIYDAAGVVIFGRIADTLEYLIKKKLVDAGSFEIKYIVARLGDNKYYIDIPTPNLHKLVHHLKEGNIDYIWHKATSSYFKEFMIFLGIIIPILILIIFFFYKKNKNHRKI